MGKTLDLWDLTEGQPEARKELEALIAVKEQAVISAKIITDRVELDASSDYALGRLFEALYNYEKDRL